MPGYLVDGRGPGDGGLLTADGPYVDLIQEQVVGDSWQVRFLRVDHGDWVEIRLIHMPNEQIAGDFVKPDGVVVDVPLEVPGFVVSEVADDDDYVELQAVGFREGVSVEVTVIAIGDEAGSRAEGTLVDVIARQVSKLTPRHQTDATTISLAPLQPRLFSIGIATVVMFFFVYPALLAGILEPSAWRRVWYRVRGRSSPPAQAIDVERMARSDRRRHLVRIGLRMVAAVTIVAVALRLPGTLLSLVTIFGGLLGWGLLERQPWYLRQGPVPRLHLFSGWARIPLLAGAGLTLALVAMGILLLFVLVVSATTGLTIPGTPIQSTGFRDVIVFAAVIVFAVSTIPLSITRRIAMRRAEALLAEDQRPPILLLRSFADDGLRVRAHRTGRFGMLERFALRRTDRFESVLAHGLAHLGPVEAVDEPGTRLPAVGAFRRRFSDTEWQDAVGRAIASSQLVVVVLGRTTFLGWEMQRLRDLGCLDKTIFVVPPVGAEERRRRLLAFCGAYSIPADLVDLEVPGVNVLCLAFSPSGVPVPFTAMATDDLSYSSAVAAACGYLAAPSDPRRIERSSTHRPIPAGEQLWFAPGQAPRYKPLLRQWWVWAVVLALLTNGLAGALSRLGGDIDDASISHELPAAVMSMTPDARGGDGVVAVLSDGSVVSSGPGSAPRTEGRLPWTSRRVQMHDSWIVAVSPWRGVAALDLDSGRTWEVGQEGTPVDLLLSDGSALISFARAEQVVELDLATGAERARWNAGTVPWGLARFEDRAVVALSRRSELAAVRDSSTPPITVTTVPDAPRQLGSGQSGVWVVSVADGELSFWSGGRVRSVHRNGGSVAMDASFLGDLAAVTALDSKVVRILDDRGNEIRSLTTSHVPGGAVLFDGGRRVAVWYSGSTVVDHFEV